MLNINGANTEREKYNVKDVKKFIHWKLSYRERNMRNKT